MSRAAPLLLILLLASAVFAAGVWTTFETEGRGIVFEQNSTAPTPRSAGGIAWVDSEGCLTYSHSTASVDHQRIRVAPQSYACGYVTSATAQDIADAATPEVVEVAAVAGSSDAHEWTITGNAFIYTGTSSHEFMVTLGYSLALNSGGGTVITTSLRVDDLALATGQASQDRTLAANGSVGAGSFATIVSIAPGQTLSAWTASAGASRNVTYQTMQIVIVEIN